MDSTTLYAPLSGDVSPTTDWCTVLPKKRSKPRLFVKGNLSRLHPYIPPITNKNTTKGGNVVVVSGEPLPAANPFTSLADFEVSTGATVTLNPPHSRGVQGYP